MSTGQCGQGGLAKFHPELKAFPGPPHARACPTPQGACASLQPAPVWMSAGGAKQPFGQRSLGKCSRYPRATHTPWDWSKQVTGGAALALPTPSNMGRNPSFFQCGW